MSLEDIGRVHMYCGTGKGKTTAALGLALRAAGAGKSVWIGQFCKGRVCSEHAALERLAPLVEMHRLGAEGFVINPSEHDRSLARSGFAQAVAVLVAGSHDLVILDEVLWAVELGLIPLGELLAALLQRSSGVEVVLTGRPLIPELVAAADLVSEIREIKHYYNEGVPARPGIEF